jgi:hypothetical protein
MKATVQIVLVSAFAFASIAQADGLKLNEKKKHSDWVKTLTTEYVSKVQKSCGHQIQVKLDEALAPSFMAANKNAGAFCGAVLDGIANTCSVSADHKAAVSSKVQSVNCASGSGQIELALTGNELKATLGTDSNDIAAKTKKYLENSL